MVRKVAVVTGANKGIGFAIVKGLCTRFQGDVYLTARDIAKGSAAVLELQKLKLNPHFHQLDINDCISVSRFGNYIKKTHGGIDILINNAGIFLKANSPELFPHICEEMIFTNYISVVSTCDILFPLLRPNARVVNIASAAGHLSRIPSEELRSKISDVNLTTEVLTKLVMSFLQSVKNQTHLDTWGDNAYAVSKVAITALSNIHSRDMKRFGIAVNSVHPGCVISDLSSHKGHMTIEEGAVAPLYLALDAPQDVTGVFMWHDKTIVDWFGKEPDRV